MSQIAIIGILAATSIVSYLLSLTSISVFLPQLIALLSILFFIFNKYRFPVIYLISLIVCLIVFTTGGIASPFFFLIYFLLFAAAFQFPPTTSLSFALITTLLLSQSLNSVNSLFTLASLIFITPLAWFISREHLDKVQSQAIISGDETDFLLWLNLKFKTGISNILDATSQLLSSPSISPSQKDQLRKIKDSSNSLLTSSQKLSEEIDQNSDET